MEKEKPKNWFKKHPIWSGVIILFLIGMVVSPLLPKDSSSNLNYNPSSNTPPTSDSLGTGEEGKLYTGTGIVGVAITEEALDELTKAAIAKDSIGYQNVFLEGKAFLVDDYTKILVIEIKFSKEKVRVLEGDYYGKSGWVPTEWVIK